MKIPNSGLFIAVFVMLSWGRLLLYALFEHELSLIYTPLLLLVIIHLYTGLFITAHDSIHGSVSTVPLINYWVGKLCLLSFAGFDYDMIREEHWNHHIHAGIQGQDPDFHRGKTEFVHWIFEFMKQYMTLAQVCRLLVFVGILWVCGAPLFRLFLFMAVAGLSSALVLFYYGTYLPHRPDEDAQDLNRPESFRTLDPEKDSRLTSFLKAYNFGCHSEHHANPRIPWWALYDAHLS
jgi:beta-carotene ketolase (CrtW type)